jgi:hypothetical protein
MGKTHSDDPLDQHTSEILDAILGPNEDFLDEEHCQEFLLALGIDPTTLLSEFKEHLEETARHHQSEGGAVPNSIVGALRVVRNRVKSSNPMNANPTAHIDLLLSGGLIHQSAGAFARAFRRESDDELCGEDQKLLDDLEAELERDQNPIK